MDAIYYSAMLLGVAWLAIWSILPTEARIRTRWWWPFDMIEEEDHQATKTQETAGDRRGGWRSQRAERAATGNGAASPPPAGNRSDGARPNAAAGRKTQVTARWQRPGGSGRP